MSTAASVSSILSALADKEVARTRALFFKTAKGEYGFGDVFLGIEVPKLRKVAKAHLNLSLTQIKKLSASKFHEERFVGLVILVLQFQNNQSNKPLLVKLGAVCWIGYSGASVPKDQRKCKEEVDF